MVEVLTWMLVGRTATLNTYCGTILAVLFFRKYLKDETYTCVTEILVFFVFSLQYLFLAFAQGIIQALHYSIFLNSHGPTHTQALS